jgi:hypothetical protein
MTSYCLYNGCLKTASFGNPDTKERKYCKTHTEPFMKNNKNKKCLKCSKRPVFNFIGEKSGLYCSQHRLQKMVDILTTKCMYCNITASFNYPNNKSGIVCSQHRTFDMISSKSCKCKICGIEAHFNYLGLRPEYCASHRSSHMFRVIRITCLKCKNKAEYGIDTELRHCVEHKEPNEINLVNLICKLCKLPGVMNSSLLCQYCNDWQNDSKRLSKQLAIKKLLDENKIEYYKYDKMIDQMSCGKERPDFLLFIKGEDNITRAVIIEVDEHQHKNITEECENIRMINIANALQMQTMFIRFNPDDYKSKIPLLNQLERQQKLLWVLNHKKLINFKSKLAAIYICYDGEGYISTKIFDNLLK